MKKISLFIVYFISFLYMEILFKLFIYGNPFSGSLLNMLLYIVLFSIFMTLITKFFKKEKVNKILFIIYMSIIAVWFCAEYICKNYFDFYISLSTFEIADQVAGGFLGKAVIETLKRIPGIILFFTPLIISLLFKKHISFKKNKPQKLIVVLVLFIVSIFVYRFSLNIGKNNTYSSYELYYNVNDVSLNINNFGILNSFTIDLKRAIFGFEDKIDVNNSIIDEKKEYVEKVYEKNILDIDFENLINTENNQNIKQMHEYFNNNPGTSQNEYTGIFKDKNLILFMGESFNEIAVDEKLTPTLYKLVNGGFTFENFYTPTIYSTIGGEFQELTGLYAGSVSILSKFRSGNNYFPQGIGNIFKETGYSTFAYHNNSYQFQDRNKYLKSLGFDNFKACYNGLEKLINCHEWPQSDVSMIDSTIADYIDEEKFMVFYASVSGHSTYKWNSNAQARKHRSEYNEAGYNYSEGPASYLAANMDLDQALKLLIEKLDEKGILGDTVIALVGDHYPYELTINEINEISKYEKDSIVEVNRSNFIFWNSEMDNVKVSKVGSQIDVIPTIYNAFGLKYDSRLFIGNDILSTTPGLAIFANRSWVSDKGTYFSQSRKFVPKAGEVVSDDYVAEMNKMVNSKITMSKMIIENNYYKKVL